MKICYFIYFRQISLITFPNFSFPFRHTLVLLEKSSALHRDGSNWRFGKKKDFSRKSSNTKRRGKELLLMHHYLKRKEVNKEKTLFQLNNQLKFYKKNEEVTLFFLLPKTCPNFLNVFILFEISLNVDFIFLSYFFHFFF